MNPMQAPPDSTTGSPVGLLSAPPLLDTPEARDALACPLCGYSLRGLAAVEHPQCPECGYRFTWEELLRARQYLHPYLFEHHPKHNVRSLVRTFLGGMSPRRFWSSLNAGHEVRPRRLFTYWLVVAVVAIVVGIAGACLMNAVRSYRQQTAISLIGGRPFLLTPGRSLVGGGFFQALLSQLLDDDNLEGYLLAAALLWPWLTLATLLVFQASMRRAKIGAAHVMRCAVYAGDPFAWVGVAFIILAVLRGFDLLGRGWMWDSTLEVRQTAVCFLLVPALVTYRLGVAYQRYLRFDRPWLTALASQAVVLTFVATVLSLAYRDVWKLVP